MSILQTGKPTDNPYIESFYGRFRDECLNAHWFLLLEDAKEKLKSGGKSTIPSDPTGV
ncbi:integrase core domain-containing protein [Sphingobacterium paludis]|uniref:integrase core domain-containing protein n=1 Tax=Sphingobacterium paludis TaxID=1476465 RepID=UPI0037437C0E